MTSHNGVFVSLLVLLLGASLQAQPQTLDPVLIVPVVVNGTNHEGRSMDFSPDGSVVVVGCDSGIAVLFDVQTGQIVQELERIPETAVIQDIHFSPDGKSITAGTWEGRLIVWNKDDGRIRYSVQVQETPVVFVRYIDNGTKISALGAPGIIRVFESSGGDFLYKIGDEGGYSAGPMVVIPGERAFYTSWYLTEAFLENRLDSAQIRKWSMEDGRVLDEFPLPWYPSIPLWTFMSTPDGSRWYRFGMTSGASGARNWLYEIDSKTFDIERKLVELDTLRLMLAFSFSPDSRRLLGGGNAQAMIWDLETAEIEYVLFKHTALIRVWDVQYNPDGRTAAALVNQDVYFWQIPTSSVENPVAGDDVSFGLQVSPNPVRTRFTATFRLDRGGPVDLGLYNVRGEKTWEFDTQYYETGGHSVEYSLPDLPSGMYWLRIESRNGIQMVPMSVF